MTFVKIFFLTGINRAVFNQVFFGLKLMFRLPGCLMPTHGDVFQADDLSI